MTDHQQILREELQRSGVPEQTREDIVTRYFGQVGTAAPPREPVAVEESERATSVSEPERQLDDCQRECARLRREIEARDLAYREAT